MMLNDYPFVLTLDEVCEILRIGKNKAYFLLSTNRLKGYREGRIWKISKEALLNYIRER